MFQKYSHKTNIFYVKIKVSLELFLVMLVGVTFCANVSPFCVSQT